MAAHDGVPVNGDQAEVLLLSLGDDAAGSPEQLDRLTLQLRRAIRELPVYAVDPVRQAPHGGREPGATGREIKSVEGAVIGAMAVKLLPEVVPVLCAVLKKWIGSSPTRRLTVKCGSETIEISGDLTPAQTAAIVQAIKKNPSRRNG